MATSTIFKAVNFRTLLRGIHRLGGFGGAIVLMAVVNVSVIPIVIRLAGATVWGGIAVSQSVAAFGAILVAFGWATTGPSDVARLAPELRGQFYVDSVASRVWLFLLVLPVIVLIVWFVAPANSLANSFAALTLVLPALGASWFFVGERSAWRMLLLETLPRALGTFGGAALLILVGNVALFTAAQAVGAFVSVVVSWINVTKRYRGYELNFGVFAAISRLPRQAGAMVTASTAALYITLPLVLIAAIAPQMTAAYSVADKLMKFSLTAFSPVTQIAQGFVPSANSEVHRRRAKIAGIGAANLGIIAGVFYAALAPLGAHVLSVHKIEVTMALSIPLGIALASIITSEIVGLACLTSFGEIKRVAMSTVLGAVMGVPLLIVCAVQAGAVGIAWATAASQLIVALYQLVYFRRLVRRPTSGRLQ